MRIYANDKYMLMICEYSHTIRIAYAMLMRTARIFREHHEYLVSVRGVRICSRVGVMSFLIVSSIQMDLTNTAPRFPEKFPSFSPNPPKTD